MRVIAVEKLPNKAKRYKVRLEGGADFVLYAAELRRYGLNEGAELSEETYQEILQKLLLPRAKKRALHLLEKQDRTEKNLRDKLRDGGYPEEVIDSAIAYVASYHYIDDLRYASNYIAYHMEDKSRRRITSDLLQKGINKEIIEQALEEGYATDERALIAGLLEKKHYNPSDADQKEKARMYRYLAGRGFSSRDIMDVMRQTDD